MSNDWRRKADQDLTRTDLVDMRRAALHAEDALRTAGQHAARFAEAVRRVALADHDSPIGQQILQLLEQHDQGTPPAI